MKKFAFVFAALAMAGCQQVLDQEPPRGALQTGQKVLVDDGRCPEGQVTEVTGGAAGVARQYQCVDRPA